MSVEKRIEKKQYPSGKPMSVEKKSIIKKIIEAKKSKRPVSANYSTGGTVSGMRRFYKGGKV